MDESKGKEFGKVMQEIEQKKRGPRYTGKHEGTRHERGLSLKPSRVVKRNYRLYGKGMSLKEYVRRGATPPPEADRTAWMRNKGVA